MKKFTIAALLITAVVSCTKEETPSVAVSSDTAVSFNAQILSRTSGDDWEANDQIGIYMYEADQISLNDYALAKENVLYISDADGKFTVDTSNDPIYYPQTDKVDFYAYYPYQELDNDGYYEADITKQNLVDDPYFDQGAVDFMTATIEDATKSTTAESFTFYHKLSKLTLVITPKSSIASLSGLDVAITGINTQATFSPITGALIAAKAVTGSVNFYTTNTTTDVGGNVTKITATAIMLPEQISSEAKLTFKIGVTSSYTATFTTTPTFVAGKNHTYYISAGYSEASFAPENGNSIEGWGENNDISDIIIDAEMD